MVVQGEGVDTVVAREEVQHTLNKHISLHIPLFPSPQNHKTHELLHHNKYTHAVSLFHVYNVDRESIAKGWWSLLHGLSQHLSHAFALKGEGQKDGLLQ